jgi:hypothetical protein
LLDLNEEQDSGLRHPSVERNKEGDGLARLRLDETKEGNAVGGPRLTIETGGEFPIGITSEREPVISSQSELPVTLLTTAKARLMDPIDLSGALAWRATSAQVKSMHGQSTIIICQVGHGPFDGPSFGEVPDR